jgi:uncharacterized protein YcbK (DUF882 family)
MKLTRRRVLEVGTAAAAWTAACATVVGGSAGIARATESGAGASKRVVFHNLHTDERLDIEFARDGAYLPQAFAAIEVLLRDFRNGEQHAIDPKLMDTLHAVALRCGVDPIFGVISGYRSPQTNEQLRERSSGVARRSLHLEGRAIDVRLARMDCASLAAHALDLGLGGVGYYRRSDFVHLDTGAFRTWKG